MPNDDHWSASMLLSWVLTRDIDAVLSMVDLYGGWRLDGENVTRLQPSTRDDVTCAYTINHLLPKDEQAREAVRKAEAFVIPACEKIYAALRRGAIDGWARPNGSGDIVRIEAIQWAGLRFRAINGHDVAVPIDSERVPLTLRPLLDYLSGMVPASITPTVWPDPLFPGERATGLWPPDESNTTKSRVPPESCTKARPGPVATANRIQIAAERLLASERVPGRTITWKEFQVELCKEIGVKPEQRGYSIDTIRTALRPLLQDTACTESVESTEN